MAWSSPPTFADTNILTASQLNILSDDVEYLYGLVSGVNTPFNSLESGVQLTAANNQWLIRHAYEYLHYKVRVRAGQNDDLEIYMNNGTTDLRLYWDSTARTTGYEYSGYIDIEDITTWGDYQGAWATSTSYGEFNIVLEAGTYYVCPEDEDHTSGTFATDLAAGKWVSIGTSTNPWTDGNRYAMYVYSNPGSSHTITVDYLLESDQTSL